MRSFFVDTNILLRIVNPSDPHHALARRALSTLRNARCPLQIAAQNLVEAWNVMTRPQKQNGFGWTARDTAGVIENLEQAFALLTSPPQVHEEWKRISRHFTVSGAQVHDARLVAVMKVHGVRHILTFDAKDFRR